MKRSTVGYSRFLDVTSGESDQARTKKENHNTPKGARTAGLGPLKRVAEKTCLGGFILSSEIDELAMMMMMNDGMRKPCALGASD
jgi:hypothetical protein